jgi:all-trans-retinol 13,14-reductase
MNDYDVIIIGAGIGGLCCGCYLAKSGIKTLILEAHDKPGVCVTSIRRKNSIFDVGAHLIGSCNKTGIFKKYLRDLGINIDFLQLDPTDRFHFPDRTINVDRKSVV